MASVVFNGNLAHGPSTDNRASHRAHDFVSRSLPPPPYSPPSTNRAFVDPSEVNTTISTERAVLLHSCFKIISHGSVRNDTNVVTKRDLSSIINLPLRLNLLELSNHLHENSSSARASILQGREGEVSDPDVRVCWNSSQIKRGHSLPMMSISSDQDLTNARNLMELRGWRDHLWVCWAIELRESPEERGTRYMSWIGLLILSPMVGGTGYKYLSH
jgi:hypothetical protein